MSSIWILLFVTHLFTGNGVVTGLTISGDNILSVERGVDINIVWKLDDVYDNIGIAIYLDKKSTPTALVLTSLGIATNNKTIAKTPDTNTDIALLDLKGRASVGYSYAGKVGKITFSLSNVQLNDSNSYVLNAAQESFTTNLSVNASPAQTSSINATLIGNEKVAVSWNVFGKPQPNVTCRIEQESPVTLKPTEVSSYRYEYTGIISNFPTTLQRSLDQCELKTVSCTATGYNGAQIKNSTIVKGECSSQQERITSEVCAGHIIGFEVGVVFIVVFIVFLAWWRVEKTRVKLMVFIFSLIIGLGLTIGLAVSYAGLRETKTNGTCDTPFIVLGVIDGIVILIALVVSFVKFKGVATVPVHGAKNEETPLSPTKQNPPPKGTENVEIK